MKHTHRKIVILIFILSLTLTVFSSCNSHLSNTTIDYCALEIGNYDITDGGNHSSEYDIWSEANLNYHFDETAPANATVTFGGKTYTGSYQRSAVWVPELYPSHRYKTEDSTHFEINGETGELVSISFSSRISENATVDFDYCQDLANSIADDYIDLSEYQLTTDTQTIYNNFIYVFIYYREVEGYRTADKLTVSIDGNGNLISFGHSMLNSFADIDSITIDQSKAIIAIENKLNTIYQSNNKRKGYDIDSVILVKLENGSYAFLYTVENQFEEADNHFNTVTNILLITQ